MSRFLRLPALPGPGFFIAVFIAALVALVAIGLMISGGVRSASAVETTFAFPSDDSTVVASVGFWDSTSIGCFWSVNRGDLVSETFTSLDSIDHATLNVEVPGNFLALGAFVDWDVEINGVVIGGFTVNDGFTGPVTVDEIFPPILGPSYEVTLRVTNEVAGGDGCHDLAYADPFAHSIELSFTPSPEITLEPPEATNTVGDDHTVTAAVEFAGDPIEGVEVTFEVTDGPNAGEVSDPGTGECIANDDCTTDVNGDVSWTYTGDGGAGTDTIQACTTVILDGQVQVQVQPEPICAEAEKTWEEEPTPTPTAIPTPSPTPTAVAAVVQEPTPTPTAVAEAVELPTTGGEPSDGGSSGLPWLAAIAGAIAVMGAGGFWFAYQRRRAR